MEQREKAGIYNPNDLFHMRIGGLIKFSVIDYPGKMAAVIFTQGCNFRCPYCHNPELVIPERFRESIPESQIWDFLQKRKGYLQGVVVTGGEPTLQKDLCAFIRKLKSLGYCVKLDTNGSHPEVIQELLREKLVDYIAMDLKAPLEKYTEITGGFKDIKKITESLDLILNSPIEHELRTTLVKPYHTAKDFSRLLMWGNLAQKYHLQRFVPHSDVLDQSLLVKENFTDQEISAFGDLWRR